MSKQLRENAASRLSSTVVDMQTAAQTVLYTVPVGFTLIITNVVIRSPTATLAGGTSYDVGVVGSNLWNATSASLVSMTATTHVRVLYETGATPRSVFVAGDVIEWDVNTGSTGAANATIDLFGYLF